MAIVVLLVVHSSFTPRPAVGYRVCLCVRSCPHVVRARASALARERVRGQTRAMSSPTVAALPVVGRWEWRTFATELGAAEARFGALAPVSVEESDEIYILSPHSDASVKVRAGVMDVKQLQAVRDDGLEQWLPTLKSPLPLLSLDARHTLDALGLRHMTTHDAETIDELVASSPGLRKVPVHKLRRRYNLGGCMAELTDLAAGGRATRTVAVEAEDPELVLNVVRELGLGGRANVSVAVGVKELVGALAQTVAVIDVGTNSVKFLLARRTADGGFDALAERAEVTRLGEDLERAGRLGVAPIARTAEAIAGMVAEARGAGAGPIAAVGTAGLRIAPNAGELVTMVRERCAVEIEVISGEEEARLAYRATTSGLGLRDASLVVFDSGGGSSQFTFGGPEHVTERFSLNVGAVGVTERFGLDGPVAEERLGSALATIAGRLTRVDRHPDPDLVVGMGGTVTNLAAVKHGLAVYDPDVVQGTVLDRLEIDRQIDLYRTRTADQRREIPGLQPNRAEVILAGACIVRSVLTLLDAGSLTVSDRGLRHGVLAERFSARRAPS
jgi:exopolyphosphatase/guanosine-5'-triphosphate,3'-diphosphate pyrophosphatase